MVKLEDLKPGMRIRGLVRNQIVTLVTVKRVSSSAVEVDYRWGDDNSDHEYLFRGADENRLQIMKDEQMWPFDADGKLLRLVSEAYRIDLSHSFDPLLAVHTSDIEPLPHQITAVYEEMLTRHPLRFLLADDPGAGKTIMAGLLIRELMVRRDVQRCLICVPGNLTEQWYDELWTKFRLRFDVFTRDMIKRDTNPFEECDQMIVRLDQAKKEDIQELLGQTNWDLIVCDEAHKMSASFSGGEVSRTQRYRLGELLSELTHHFLLMTATPHNGKDEDFQLFLKLLDVDRFEGRFRDDVHRVDVSDLMRRVVKEDLQRFDGKPLFPERRAYTVDYDLSSVERTLYDDVTEYIRNEFNRAEQLTKGRNTVGFALTILQRRLASSPEAIYQSLKSRLQRLEERLEEEHVYLLQAENLTYDEEDFEDLPASEREEQEDKLIDKATAARNIGELRLEIDTLRGLESQADNVRRSGRDRKWEKLREVFDAPAMKKPDGTQRKLVIFTEHLATLHYLIEQLNTLPLFSHPNAVVAIYGSILQGKRREVEESFRNNPDTLVLVATDAAGEGINLQQAHLMVNYDLPWNPNRLEQRFGRIHRIGQNEVCHLWNLVAGETREGAVYHRLLEKLEAARNALGGQVYDVLGELFQGRSLRELLVNAIREPQQLKAIDAVIELKRFQDIMENQVLVTDNIDTSKIMQYVQTAEAGRLQPFYVKAFFLEALKHFRGKISKHKDECYEIKKVPQVIRNHAKDIRRVHPEYQRICFEKDHIRLSNQPEATWIRPGHPLLDATKGLILQQERDSTLKHGAMLVDENDNGTQLRVLLYLEQSIQAASLEGKRHPISCEVHFIEIDKNNVREAGVAPYLDYRPATSEDKVRIKKLLRQDWLNSKYLEERAVRYMVECLVRPRLEDVRARHIEHIDKTKAAVREQLTKRIAHQKERITELEREKYWANGQEEQERLERKRRGAQAWADELARRLEDGLEKLEWKRQVSATPPIVRGVALIIPIGLLQSEQTTQPTIDRSVTEKIAMQAVMQAEIDLGNHPEDVSKQNRGYDIQSRDEKGQLRFIEVKGRRADADTVTLTYNELITALNCAERFILALVEVEGETARQPRYLRGYAFREPNFTVSSFDFKLKELLAQSEAPN